MQIGAHAMNEVGYLVGSALFDERRRDRPDLTICVVIVTGQLAQHQVVE
jgi:hypothetical protein